MTTADPVIDAAIDVLDAPHPESSIGTRWVLVADTVMGGVSSGRMVREDVAGRNALRLTGDVRLDNNGGFLQIALDLAQDGEAVDASAFTGIALSVRGNGERYNVHLRTTAVVRPWQSYRASFDALPEWRTVTLPFKDFSAHRIAAPLEPAELRRVGIVAIGRAFEADVALSRIGFYRAG